MVPNQDPQLTERIIVVTVAAVTLLYYYLTIAYKTPCRTSALTGRDYVNEVMAPNVNPVRFYEVFKMPKRVLNILIDSLIEQQLLGNSPRVSIEEKIAIFMSIVTRPASNRLAQERFQHSGETISR